MKLIPVNLPEITEEDKFAVLHALEQTMISGDTKPVKDFEVNLSKYLGVSDTVAVSSGTSALDLSVEALNIEQGDECIVPSFTIISTVSQLFRKGASITLIDADPITWSIDSKSAVEEMRSRTKLIIPVHIYGLSADMDPIVEKARTTSTFVLEDSAEALGVNYKGKKCGSLGDGAVFSYYANKIVTGGEGGSVSTNNSDFANRIRALRNLAFNPNERFVHDEIGWNSRWNGLSAALANSQLMRIENLVERKRRIAGAYRDRLHDHPWFEIHTEGTDYSENAYWVVGILLRKEAGVSAKKLQESLKTKGVDTRRFFCPIHLQPVAKNFRIRTASNMSVSNNLWENGLYLPSGLGITDLQIDQVADVLWSFLN